MPLLVVPILVILAFVALIPISLIQRYRVGTSRQRARGWLAMLNVVGLVLSSLMFLASAAITNVWIPGALAYTAAGLGAGLCLGLLGLWLTRWEPSAGALFYTPNRPLVLAMTLLVTARVLYGFWRAWQTSASGLAGASWVVAAGVEKTMAAGGIVLGYYLAYWLGVRSRLRRHSGDNEQRRKARMA